MQHCDTLITPRWCIPVEPEHSVLTNHAVAVSDGRILDVLPVEDATARFQPSLTVDRPGHVLLPGLINTHTHAAMTLLRGFAEDLPLERWLREAVWPAESSWVSPELVRDGTALAIAEMIRSGTTCFADQYFFPEIVAETASSMQMRAVIGTPLVDFPTAWASGAEDCLSKGSDLVHDAYVDHPLIDSSFAPHSTYAVSDESFQQLRILADQLDIRVQIHLHETAREVADSVRDYGQRPLARLQSLDLVNSSLLAVHGVHLDDADIELLASVGASVAHCPKSNLKLASGFAPVAAFQQHGLNVGIGTDSAAGNNVLDMFEELRFAALIGKTVANDASTMAAFDVLKMVTIDGARALGLDSRIGSLQTGKAADMICVDLSGLNSQPIYDPLAQLIYTARADQVTDVWIAGRQQLEHRELAQIDTEQLTARGDEWRQRIAGQSGA